MIEIFLPSYFGTLINVESERLPYEAFKSNWSEEDGEYKKCIMILTERTLRPMKIRAGNVFELSLTTFLKVIITCNTFFIFYCLFFQRIFLSLGFESSIFVTSIT